MAASHDMTRLTRAVGIAVLLLVTLAGIDAALSLRSLFGDGFYYLIRILETESVKTTYARQTVDYIRQIPLRVAPDLGIENLHTLALILGLSVQLVPLAIVALVWFALPRESKFLFVFPLLHVVTGTMAGAWAPIAEGATAAAYFWLLFFCLVFNAERRMGMAVVVALAAGTVRLHEAMVFLAPLLALVAIWRARRASHRPARIVFVVLAAWFIGVAAVHADFIVHAPLPGNRDAFFGALQNGFWIRGFEGHINLPAIHGLIGLGAVVALAGLQLLPARWRPWYVGWALIAAGAVVVLWEAGAAVAEGRVLASSAQFNSRNNALLVSLPLAVGAFGFVLWPRLVRPWALHQALAIAVVLAVATTVWHVGATRYWAQYIETFRKVLANHRGFVAWDAALASLPPGESRILQAMRHGWIEPSISIVLAEGGNVRTILGPSRPADWQGFYPLRPETLPRARFWSYGEYLNTLVQPKPVRQE